MRKRIISIVLSIAIMLSCILFISDSGIIKAASIDTSGNWSCTILDKSKKTISIKPAKSGVSKVSKGDVVIPATLKINSTTYNVTGLTESGWKDNKSITSVTMGKKLTKINTKAFYGCTALTKVSFSAATSLTTISDYAFSSCSKLKTVTGLASTKVKTIGKNAFYKDKLLVGNSSSVIDLPSTLTSIGASCFYGCSTKTTINAKTASISSIGANAFYGMSSNSKIYVKNATVYNLLTKSGTIAADKIAWNYTVYYSGNGQTSGSTAATQMVYGTSKNIAANGFGKTGYLFSSWNTRGDGTGTSIGAGSSRSNLTKTGSITLYAIWKANTYYISFNGNGQTAGTTARKTMTYNKADTLTSNGFTKTGYYFSKWNTKADGTGSSYANNATVKNLSATNNATVALYAIWNPNPYSIIFIGNGHTSGTTARKEMTYDKADKLTKLGYLKKGYSFVNWNTKPDGTGTSYGESATVKNLTSIKDGIVYLHAIWKPNKYKIIFDPNGGVGEEQQTEATYDLEKTLPLCSAKKKGYSFVNWNTKPDGTGKSYESYESVKNLTDEENGSVILYAIWRPIEYNIEFNIKDATGYAPDILYNVKYGEKIKIPEYDASRYSKFGYSFLGWTTKEDGSGDLFEAGKEYDMKLSEEDGDTVVLYALWSPIEFTLEFVNAYSDKFKPIKFKITDIVYLDTPSRDGYNFTGWYDNAECTGKKYSSGVFNPKDTNAKTAIKKVLEKNNGTVIKMYAAWEPKTYTVFLNDTIANGSRSIYMKYNTAFTQLPKLSTEGYTFLGWTTTNNGKVYVKNGDLFKYTTDISLYAKWQINTYEVKFDANKGKISGKTKITKKYKYEERLYSKFSKSNVPEVKSIFVCKFIFQLYQVCLCCFYLQ
ncbi:MAG: InlB B-repeat-containing protein [Agathobacter sp.]|nr:InlB B-repeat-containing protein [Agathobacter sp.]